MQRYILSRWADIVLGTGAFFVVLGFIVFADKSLIIPTFSGITTVLPFASPVPGLKEDLWEVPFSLLFYGGLQMMIGLSILLLQHFGKKKSSDLILLNNQLDQEAYPKRNNRFLPNNDN